MTRLRDSPAKNAGVVVIAVVVALLCWRQASNALTAPHLRIYVSPQMVPTLIIKDKNLTKKPIVLSESMAICEYLEEAYPNKRKLLPKDPVKRFQVRRLCEMINAGTQPGQNLGYLQEI